MPAVPQAIVHSVLDSAYNATLIAGFLYGVYTLFLVQTLRKLHKIGGKKRYSAALLLLWFCCMVDYLIQWVADRNAFVLDNTTSADIAEALISPVSELVNIPLIIGTIIADGIIVWHCNILWGKWWILCLLCLMLSTTAACALAAAIIPLTHSVDGVLGAVYFCTSAATNIVATSLISIKIILTTRRNATKYSYSNVVQILVQSAAMTTVVTLALSIIILIPHIRRVDAVTEMGRALWQADIYISSLEAPIMGFAPTLLAVCVIESQTEGINETTTPAAQLSGLVFRRTAPDDPLSSRSSYIYGEGRTSQGGNSGPIGESEHISDDSGAKAISNLEKDIY